MKVRLMLPLLLILFVWSNVTSAISILEEILLLNLNKTETVNEECKRDLFLTRINFDLEEPWAIKRKLFLVKQ